MILFCWKLDRVLIFFSLDEMKLNDKMQFAMNHMTSQGGRRQILSLNWRDW